MPSRGAKNVVIVAHSPFGKKYTTTLELSDVDVRVPVSVVEDMKKAMDEGANTICMDVLRREDGTAVLTSGVLLSEMLDATEAYTAEKGYSPIRYHFTIHRGPESYDKTADAVMQELIYRYISERVTVETSDRLLKNFIKEKYPEFKLEDGFEAKLSDQVLLDYINGSVSLEDMREHVKVEEQKWIRKAKKFSLYDDQPYRIK